MKYILSTLLFSIVLISCATTKESKENLKSNDSSEFKAVSKSDSLFAYIKRGVCYGTCPSYEMKIYNSGFVEMTGIRAVDLIGDYTTTITADQMRAFIEKAESINYFSMEDAYDNEMVTDLPETKTSIVIDGKRKEVRRRYNFPKEIVAFETLFDSLLKSEKWTKIGGVETEEPRKK